MWKQRGWGGGGGGGGGGTARKHEGNFIRPSLQLWYNSLCSERGGGSRCHVVCLQTHISPPKQTRGSQRNGMQTCLMMNLLLFTVGCLNVCVGKMEATIVTHNPEAFEMERRHFERGEDLGSGAGCLYLDGILD